VLTLLVISCDLASLVPPAAPIPSPVPGAVDTIVAQTAAAASTQTAANAPPTSPASSTPPPSNTPTPTPSPTPTFFFVLASLTPTRRPTSTSETVAGFGCQLVSQSPADGSHFAKKQNFKATWKIKNTGKEPWDSGSVDFTYLSGSKMFVGSQAYDLPDSVGVDGSVSLSVPMAAPKNSGEFRTVWTLRQGKADFCHVDLQIVVP